MKILDKFVDRTAFGIDGKLNDLIKMFPSYEIFLKDGENLFQWEQLDSLFDGSVYVPGIMFYEKWMSGRIEFLDYPEFLWSTLHPISKVFRVCKIDNSVYDYHYHVLYYDYDRCLKPNFLNRSSYCSKSGRQIWEDKVKFTKIDCSILIRRYWDLYDDEYQMKLYNSSQEIDTYGPLSLLEEMFQEE